MKILVTGHNGFIGSHFFRHLNNDHEVQGFEWGENFPGYDFDWIIHAGAVSSTTESNVELVMKKNYDFTVDLIKNCDRYKVNLQFSSSASVYGLGNTFTESSAVDPRTPYAWSKYLVERYIASRSWDIHIQSFRYFNVYGSGEDHKGNQASPHHKFRKQFEKLGYIEVFEGSENFFRDFIPVETVVNIQSKFLHIPESGLWNIGTGQAQSFADVAKKISSNIKYVPMPQNLLHSYQRYTQADLYLLNHTLNQYSCL